MLLLQMEIGNVLSISLKMNNKFAVYTANLLYKNLAVQLKKKEDR